MPLKLYMQNPNVLYFLTDYQSGKYEKYVFKH